MNRALILGLSAGVILSLTGLAAYRTFAPTVPQAHASESVQISQVWGAALPDLSNDTQAIKQWQGKVLILNFWAPWCPPCRAEIPGFVRLQDKFGAEGLQFVGIALDEHDKVQNFADETAINYPILLGDLAAVNLSRAAGNRLGGLPYTLVLNRRGSPVATLIGGVDEARIEGIIKPLL